ncbi:MAG TPA: hypothetical protein VFE51_26670 [Verrucomicrobiae bacterium]|nr:hypothetical protein [Verrucomicrobiae bacterium]
MKDKTVPLGWVALASHRLGETGATIAVLTLLLTGCQTALPPDTEQGPDGTIAYKVPVESSEAGARIEVNGESVGTTPMVLKIFADRDGTFHNFGSYEFIVRALPPGTGRAAQTKVFYTGVLMGKEDRIPDKIYFDFGPKQNPQTQ